jgi:pimeloyl-ACP methyl ester carboxylesterase
MDRVILLPGLACDGELFAEQASVWSAGQEIVASDVHFRGDTLPAMVDMLLAEQVGPLTLIGSSMGGMLALLAALVAPGRVRRIAVLGSSARADTEELLALRSQAIELFAAGRVDEVLRANLAFAFHADHAARLADRYVAMIRRAGAHALIRQNRAVMARADLRPQLAQIHCPTLVLCGEDDALTPPECSREMAAAIPGAELHLVPRCGHLCTLEQPLAVNAALQNFLRATA